MAVKKIFAEVETGFWSGDDEKWHYERTVHIDPAAVIAVEPYRSLDKCGSIIVLLGGKTRYRVEESPLDTVAWIKEILEDD